MIANSDKGLYQPGQTLLHRLDPRVKVLSCLLLVSLVFAADSRQLLLLGSLVLVAVWSVSPSRRSILHVCWTLRWLLLFTLLMHLLFSPGRTLWGVRWLSLDGLITGWVVCLQMLLAVAASALLAITTSTDLLSRTFGWFVQPLQWLGCKTDEWQKILTLTIDFIPAVQKEMNASVASDADGQVESSQIRQGRWSVWQQKLQDFISRMVDQGDKVAHRIACNEGPGSLPSELPPLMPMVLHDQLFSLAIALVVVCYMFAG